jgi:uncharacterized protein with ATP-grasp and redox domains
MCPLLNPPHGVGMAKGKLFEYAVIYHPKEKKDAAGNATETKKSVLVQSVTTVLAGGEQEVGIIAAKSIGEEYMDKLEDVEIVIRPFN